MSGHAAYYNSLSRGRSAAAANAVAVFCCLAALGLVSATVGCGSGDTETTVTGTVLLNGTPLDSGRVLAADEDGETVSGAISQGGQFTLTRGDTASIPPGNYRVSVVAYENAGLSNNPEAELKLLIPDRYTQPSTSKLSFSVSAGEAKNVEFDLER